MQIRLPRLFDGELMETARLHPISLSIEDNLTPLSTASMSLAEGETVPLHAFIELYTGRGSAGVYRARSVTQAYTEGASVELEHAACVLGDAIIPGEGTLTGTPGEIAAQLLAHQTMQVAGRAPWIFGESAEGAQISFDYDNSNILSALIDLAARIDGCALGFDQSAFPWRVNIVRKETAPSCEGRISRNLRSVSVTLDDSELCTRIYCDKLPEPGYIDGPNASVWGVICKTLSATEDVTQESLTDYIRRYLDDHKEPKVSIEVDADDLSAATGEPLDRFEKGRLFRLALPDYGVTLEERILSVRTGSVYGDPENVRLTLANNIRDTAENFVRIDNSMGSGVSQNSTGRYISGRGGGSGGVSQATVLDMLKKSDQSIDKAESWIREAGVQIESNAAGLYATKASIFGNWTEKPETINALIQASSDNGGIVSMLVGRKYDGEEVSALIAGTAAGGGLITLKASQKDLDDVEKRVSGAEIDLQGKEQRITALAGTLDEQGNLIEGVQLDLQGKEQRINALAGAVDEQGELIEGVQLDLDGANSRITQEAKRIDDLTGEISAAKLELDGANQKITALTGTVDEQGKLIQGVQLDLDGKEQRINALAGTVDAQGNLINGVQVDIDGLNTSLTSKVSKDGIISSINQTPETVTIDAGRINLEGYVTASQLSAVEASMANLTTGVTQASTLYTQNLTATNTVRLSGHTLQWGTYTVVNSFTQASGETQNGDRAVLGVALSTAGTSTYTPSAGETITF